MGLDTRRPPLPAPTDMSSTDEKSAVGTEVATNVTDKTSYSIPEDGSPITISTHKVSGAKEGRHHSRQKSQTSLLIEYFEAGKKGDKARSKPSVRVKVTPSSRKSSRQHDAVQITSVGKDRKPSYTRRISLSGKGSEAGGLEPTEVSQSTGSSVSQRPPVEVEILNQDGSDLSQARSSRGLMYSQLDSNVSSMPPDSMVEGSMGASELSRDTARDEDEELTVTEKDHLKAPIRSRDRSVSQERLTQKVMEKLGQNPGKSRKSSHDYDQESGHRRRRSSKSHKLEDDGASGVESSLLSSNPTGSQLSWRSSTSQASSMTKNPKLLEMVEDTIKRMILPEISAIREDQRVDRNHRTFEEGRRGSAQHSDYDKSSLQRSVSKSSSTPHLTSRPKVVLNRDGDDPGTVLSRGDSEYRKHGRKSSRDRPSSRRSSGRHSVDNESYTEEATARPESRKSSHRARDAAAGAIAGGILTSAALKHHDSQGDVHERRKKRSKSRSSHSRSASAADTVEDYRREELIPPMPMASHINDSELTRESILSDNTAMPESDVTHNVQTPVREVSRGSVEAAMSPTSSRTPTRTHNRGLGMSHSNQSIQTQSSGGISTKARIAALAAAGLGGAAATKGFEEHHEHNVDADGYGGTPPPRPTLGSPAQSVSSLRNKYEEPLIPSALRPRSAASRSSVSRLRESTQSPAASLSAPGSPSTRMAASRKQSQNDEFITPLERPEPGLTRSGMTTPVGGESIDEWYERQHQQNDRYRDSFDATTNRTSYQTNPYPEDEKRFSTFTQDSQPYSQVHSSAEDQLSIAQDVRGLGANPDYVHHPGGVESNVASLVDPSTLSSGNFTSSLTDSAKTNGTYSDRMAEHLRSMGKDESAPAPYEGSTLSESMPSQSRWAALKSSAAGNLSASPGASREQVDVVPSPKQSETRSLRQERSLDESPVKMGASGLPVADDPLPEIGHFDDTKSEVSTNPSVVQGPLGGDATGKSTWPYTPSPPRSAHSQREGITRGDGRSLKSRDSRDLKSVKSGHGREAALLGAGVGAGAALAGMKASHKSHQPRVEDEYDEQRSLTPDTRRYSDEPRNDGKLTPGRESFREERYDNAGKLTPDARHHGEYIDRNATPTSPAMLRDEGYDTQHDRSAGALTPKAEQHFGKADVDDFNRAMNGPGEGDDPFIGDVKHARHVSGGSHGMASPLYDSSTGKGMNNIASKDIVALMDHLTVRDAARNARDTEILVTLVRSATEMRANFDEMKQFIMDQDRMIMQNTDRDADQTVQRVLGGPRPQPPSTPRTPRQTSQEDVQAKRKGVLRRALKGLTGGKSASDLTRIEDMLNQILDNVEDLKHQGVAPRQPMSSYLGNDSMDSYEKLRAAPDSGYEPEGAAGTDSTPSGSGNLSITPRGEKHQFHSGYNGRPGSVNRVSTVLEGDEDEESYLAPHERQVLDNQFENNERLSTPTQERYSQHSGRGLTPTHTPPRQFTNAEGNDLTPKTAEKQRKHNSNSSSLFAAVPKISRWSKTTSSSAAPDPASINSPNMARNERPRSQASMASSSMQSYDSYDSLADNDHMKSNGSLSRGQDTRSRGAETRSMRSQASRLTRTPSPLIPSEASYRSEDYDDLPPQQRSPVQQDESLEFEDPKYQAHRNSLLLEHPQPRQGPTSRHQNTLEHQAHNYGDDPAGLNTSALSQSTVSDFDPAMWGSSGAAALNRNRFSAAETSSPASMSSPRTTKTQQSQPQQQQPPQQKTSRYDDYDDDEEEDWEPEYSNSGFAKNNSSRMYYSSPLGSGHLLEPIEEVRYSLETDSGRVRAYLPA